MSFSLRNNAPAVPRRVVIFGVLLSLSLALLGIFGSLLVAQLNHSYQEIVSRQLPSIGIMRAVSQANAYGRRLIDSLGINATEAQVTIVENKLEEMRDSNSLRLARLQGLLENGEGYELTEALLAARKTYRTEVNAFLKEIRSGMTDDRRDEWMTRLADADLEYVSAQDKLADYCSTSATAVSEELGIRSKRLTSYFLLIAAWPLVLAGGFFLYGLCSTLVLFYRVRR